MLEVQAYNTMKYLLNKIVDKPTKSPIKVQIKEDRINFFLSIAISVLHHQFIKEQSNFEWCIILKLTSGLLKPFTGPDPIAPLQLKIPA